MLVGETSSSSWECLLHLLLLFSAGLGQPTLQGAHGQGFPALLGRRVLLSPCDTLNLHTDPRRWLAPAPARLSLLGTPTSPSEAPLPPRSPRSPQAPGREGQGLWGQEVVGSLTQQVGGGPGSPKRGR